MNEELKKLLEGSDFSVEFKEQVSNIFEAAVESKVNTVKEELEERASAYAKYMEKELIEKYDAVLETAKADQISKIEEKSVEYMEKELVPMVEKYLDYSMKEYFKENKIVAESNIKVDLADKFLKGFVGLTEQYNVTVSKDQDSLVEELQSQFDKLQTRFDSLLEEKNDLETKLVESKKLDVIGDQVKDLTESQKEKFVAAAMELSFKSKDQYVSAVADLYENYYPSTKGQKLDETIETKTKFITESDKWLDAFMKQI